jgi:hypothetical protein
MLPFVSENNQTKAIRDIKNASNQANRSYRVAMVYAGKYLNTPLGKIEGSIIRAESWLKKKLK